MGAMLTFTTTGVLRDIHWHNRGDEWAYVIRGSFRLAMTAPTKFAPRSAPKTVPWEGTYSTAGPGSVWFFPKG
eukprot:2201171-Prymnesium_polylepis.1